MSLSLVLSPDDNSNSVVSGSTKATIFVVYVFHYNSQLGWNEEVGTQMNG